VDSLSGTAACGVSLRRSKSKIDHGRIVMRWQLAAVLATSALCAAGGAALAHHSFAMFNTDNPLDLQGTVTQFKFTSPHTFILLAVKDKDGEVVVWNLEGGSPTQIQRDGWGANTLKAGDTLKVTIDPLRSGAPGGAWVPGKVKYQDGKPIVAPTQTQ
jgi:hypothetical protein